MKLIDKDKIIAEIERVLNSYDPNEITSGRYALAKLRDFINTLEVKDPYEECIQYDSIKAGIQAHAETYSFNIESILFNQLTKDQQELWRKEIEQAVISGGEFGVELAGDFRYKENLEVEEVDFEKEVSSWWDKHYAYSKGYKFGNLNGHYLQNITVINIAKDFYELGLKQKENSYEIMYRHFTKQSS